MKAIRLLALTFICTLAFAGCATDTNDPVRNARGRAKNAALLEAGKVLGQAGVSALLNAGEREMSGGKQDFGSSAAAGVWSVVNANTVFTGIGRIVSAYSGGNLPDTASTANRVAAEALQSGASPQKVTSAIAAVISTAAGAPPL